VFGLRYFFYPWGLILEAIALVHFIRRRPEWYWLWVILIGGSLGAGVYIVVEVLPDAGLLRNVFNGFGRRSRIQVVETQILDNPSAANLEELGELYFDERQYVKAAGAFDRAIAVRSDSPHTFYSRAKCFLNLGEPEKAIPDLELAVSKDIKFDHYRAAGLLGDAYARTGQLERAAPLFAEVTQFSTTSETLYNYANFLRLQNRPAEAREWIQKLLAKKRTLPRYMQRRERPWFRKGKLLLKNLSAA
jgi:hypothetical protein